MDPLFPVGESILRGNAKELVHDYRCVESAIDPERACVLQPPLGVHADGGPACGGEMNPDGAARKGRAHFLSLSASRNVFRSKITMPARRTIRTAGSSGTK